MSFPLQPDLLRESNRRRIDRSVEDQLVPMQAMTWTTPKPKPAKTIRKRENLIMKPIDGQLAKAVGSGLIPKRGQTSFAEDFRYHLKKDKLTMYDSQLNQMSLQEEVRRAHHHITADRLVGRV